MGEWNEKELEEIMKQIENSTEGLKVPESLEPENIKKKLRENNVRRKLRMKKTIGIAAAAAFAVIVGGTGIYGRMADKEYAFEHSKGMDTFDEEENAGINVPVPKKKQVGSYRLAESYDEIYDICDAAARRESEKQRAEYINGITEGITEGAVINDLEVKKSEESADMFTPEEESNAGSSENGDYSTTNTQVEGVDESDFVKNDGNYLYLQSEDTISVVDIRQNKMKNVAQVEPEMNTGDTISDIYIDGDRLFVILQKRENDLKKTNRKTEEIDIEESYAEDIYYIEDGKMTMELLTYDISDRSSAKLLGTVEQDGTYYDSRKVGDYIYLFSEKWMNVGSKDAKDDVVPLINGEKVNSDCIYIQDDFNREMIVSSVNANEPEKTVDVMVLMDSYAQIYVSTSAIYLYQQNYEWSGNDGGSDNSYTDLAKFSYSDGKMNGVAAGTVRGTIEDVFAISEADGVLRVLTTEWKPGASENQLYLLDKNLKELGSLKNIAVGEEIYAARYIGNIAYFITYHNTDPLFAVDISNPKKPKMLGQVEITGYSDYLHPFGDDLLLGIGYETDPDTSERMGVKLVMFDISNPTKLKVKDSVTMKGDLCNAVSDYKCALVNKNKNLIGFDVINWENNYHMDYKLYSWNGKKFVKKLSQDLDYEGSQVRGLYAGSRFYIVSPKDGGFQILSYDMKKDFKKIDKLVTE